MKRILQKPTVKPKNKKELKDLIEFEMEKNGNRCDLNHIDVSLITNLSGLFLTSNFNGDISKWDVLAVTDMSCMFEKAKFNGDISRWNVSSLMSMNAMFYGSKFNGDISKWDVSSVSGMSEAFEESNFCGDVSSWIRASAVHDSFMFSNSEIAKKLGIENPSFDEVKSHFLDLHLEVNLEKAPPLQVGSSKVRL